MKPTNPDEKTIIYFIYVRQSQKNEGNSLANQVKICRNYIANKHKKAEYKEYKTDIVGIFKDDEVSGAWDIDKRKRQDGMVQLRDEIAKQKSRKSAARVLVVKNTSRIARNMRSFVDLERFFEEQKGVMIEYTEIGGRYMETAQGSFMKNTTIAADQFVADVASDRQKEAIAANINEGSLHQTTRFAYGLKKEQVGDNDYEVGPTNANGEADTVKAMYEAINVGKVKSKQEMYELHSSLTGEVIDKRSKKRVEGIMGEYATAVVYSGMMRNTAGEVIEANVTSKIMEYSEYESAINKWDKLKANRGARDKEIHGFWLIDKMASKPHYDKGIEKRMNRNIRKGRGKPSYTVSKDEAEGIAGYSVDREEVNQVFQLQVLKEIRIVGDGEKSIIKIITDRLESYNKAIENSKKDVRKEIETKHKAVQYYDRLAKSGNKKDEKDRHQDKIKELKDEIDKLEDRLIELEEKKHDVEQVVSDTKGKYVNPYYYWSKIDDKDRKELVEFIISGNLVYSKDRKEFVDIELNELYEWQTGVIESL